jgi:hypothetical protein
MHWNDMAREDFKYLKTKGFDYKITKKALGGLKV